VVTEADEQTWQDLNAVWLEDLLKHRSEHFVGQESALSLLGISFVADSIVKTLQDVKLTE